MIEDFISKLRINTSPKQIVTMLLFLSIIITPIISQAIPTKVVENILDGVISENEYSNKQSTEDENFVLHWQTSDDNRIFFAMKVKTTGWVAIGLDPSDRMEDADMYIGWVNNNGSVGLIDAFSVGAYGPHPPDTELGGEDNIIAFNGSEVDQITIIEFERGITTSDSSYDKTIPLVGEITIIWAYGTTDNYLDQHAGVSRGTIFWNLQGASILKYDFSQPLILGLAFFITLTGLLFYVESKGRSPKNNTDLTNGD